MRSLIVASCMWAGLGLAACTSSPAHDTGAEVQAPAADEASAKRAPTGKESLAYFAGGCFWGVEHYLEQMDGVLSVESGYMGGPEENPTYEQVSRHATKHLEAVRVRFDPGLVDYEAVAKRFFEIHDPTQANGQGPDIGGQYLSAVFYADDAQKAATEGLIATLKTRGYDVVTNVREAGPFWAAEDYHQDYYKRNGKKPYCHTRVRRFGD